MPRLAAVASATTQTRLLSAYPQLDFEFPRHLERCLRTVPINGVFIVGPDAQASDVSEISEVLEFPRMPVIFCGNVTREVATLVALIKQHANPRVFIERFDDERVVTQFVNEQTPVREHLRFRSAIQESVARLPGRVRLHLDTAMRELPVDAVVGILAARIGHTERRLLDIMHEAGFRNTYCVFQGQRIIDAWAFAQDPGYDILDIARKCGYEGVAGLTYLLNHFGVESLTDLASIPSGELVALVTTTTLRS